MTQHSLVSRVSDSIMEYVQNHRTDPVQNLMRGNDLPEFLAAPVPVEGLEEDEIRRLVHDYVWKGGRKPKK